jgi:hypothetical protein
VSGSCSPGRPLFLKVVIACDTLSGNRGIFNVDDGAAYGFEARCMNLYLGVFVGYRFVFIGSYGSGFSFSLCIKEVL